MQFLDLNQKEKRKCVAKFGRERKVCLLGAQGKVYENKIRLLTNLKSKCKNSKSPDACMKGVDIEIQKLKIKYSKVKQKEAKMLVK